MTKLNLVQKISAKVNYSKIAHKFRRSSFFVSICCLFRNLLFWVAPKPFINNRTLALRISAISTNSAEHSPGTKLTYIIYTCLLSLCVITKSVCVLLFPIVETYFVPNRIMTILKKISIRLMVSTADNLPLVKSSRSQMNRPSLTSKVNWVDVFITVIQKHPIWMQCPNSIQRKTIIKFN